MNTFDKYIEMCSNFSEPDGSCNGCQIFQEFLKSKYGSCQGWMKNNKEKAIEIINNSQLDKSDAAYEIHTNDDDANFISINEKLPAPGERVIVLVDNFVGEAYADSQGKWMRNGIDLENFFSSKVTHWMRMPHKNNNN